jgi:alkylation response protein AidB-like acyl-CoA dehydrogenase
LHERVLIAARCCGAAFRLIEEATAFAKERVQFGSPISEYQMTQQKLADSLTELWAARLMTYAAAKAADPVRFHPDDDGAGKRQIGPIRPGQGRGRLCCYAGCQTGEQQNEECAQRAGEWGVYAHPAGK